MAANRTHSAHPPGPLMLDLEGLTLTDDEKNLLREPLVGGVIFFSRNFQSRGQLEALVGEIRAVRPELLLAVDQEGGRVQRFREGFTRLPPMQSFLCGYRADPAATLERVRDAGWLMAAEILAADVDFSFAPVLDVDEEHCSVIADRAFSADPQEVSRLAEAFIEGMHEAGMAATGKHFPGHGGVRGDSHLVLPIDERNWREVEARDWQPFLQLRAILDAVMPAHIVFPAVDEQPVGFSRPWLQEKLRGQLGFEGVIFSDDLSMEGAAAGGSYGDRAELALGAGCDMVLVCNNRSGALEVLDRLKRNPPDVSPRLSTMRKRRDWDWSALQADPRWRHCRAELQAVQDASRG
ncbi:beta-N-acetylhexosaminidase [Gilvimarinus sp. F26214L]|uniref:beta-N-acetylhexosaminidase n=1 Tax=Gilvimarinus sp. DZF01 TaxID=3461371 RepID=UPI0040455B1F